MAEEYFGSLALTECISIVWAERHAAMKKIAECEYIASIATPRVESFAKTWINTPKVRLKLQSIGYKLQLQHSIRIIG